MLGETNILDQESDLRCSDELMGSVLRELESMESWLESMRRHPCYRWREVVLVRIDDFGGPLCRRLPTLQISEGGIAFLNDFPLFPSELIRITVPGIGLMTRHIDGRVRRVRAVGPRIFEINVRWCRANHGRRLIEQTVLNRQPGREEVEPLGRLRERGGLELGARSESPESARLSIARCPHC
jgi:hypothetical protein